jgi:hypothetical protein
LAAELELMKERFSKLLLGEDMSGSGKGVCTALAISNAITNLCGEWSHILFLGLPVRYVGIRARTGLLSIGGDRALTRWSAGAVPCACSDDFRAAVEAGAAGAGEEGHVAAGDGLAALRQRPHRRARAHMADLP